MSASNSNFGGTFLSNLVTRPEFLQYTAEGIFEQSKWIQSGIVKDRSSVATRRQVFTVAGVIDNGYIGEICIALYNGTDSLIHIGPGEKIAQLVLIPTVDFEVEEVTEVVPTDLRADAGFGSTGS